MSYFCSSRGIDCVWKRQTLVRSIELHMACIEAKDKVAPELLRDIVVKLSLFSYCPLPADCC